MVRPTWGAVVTVRDHVYKGASQCLSHGRLLINDSSWHHRDTPAPPPAEGCDAWGDHPNLVYLFTHILGEVRKHLVRGGLGPEQLLACASPVPPLPSFWRNFITKERVATKGPPFLLFSLDFLFELLRLTAWWDCHLKEVCLILRLDKAPVSLLCWNPYSWAQSLPPNVLNTWLLNDWMSEFNFSDSGNSGWYCDKRLIVRNGDGVMGDMVMGDMAFASFKCA